MVLKMCVCSIRKRRGPAGRGLGIEATTNHAHTMDSHHIIMIIKSFSLDHFMNYYYLLEEKREKEERACARERRQLGGEGSLYLIVCVCAYSHKRRLFFSILFLFRFLV